MMRCRQPPAQRCHDDGEECASSSSTSRIAPPFHKCGTCVCCSFVFSIKTFLMNDVAPAYLVGVPVKSLMGKISAIDVGLSHCSRL